MPDPDARLRLSATIGAGEPESYLNSPIGVVNHRGLGPFDQSPERVALPPRRKPRRPATPDLTLLVDQTVLVDQAAFDAALDRLAALDPRFVATTLADGPRPALRQREAGLEGLVGIVVAQQVSTASANAIFGRLKACLGAFDAAAVEATSDEALRLCGLSASKLRTIRAIAEAEREGLLEFTALATMEAEAAHAALCAIKGIGPWTANVFLLFCLGHADAWPAGDLALQEGAKLALGLAERPDTAGLIAIGERWRPLRGVAAHCLWAYYRATRKVLTTLDAAPAGDPD